MGWNDGSKACYSYYITTTTNNTDASNNLIYTDSIDQYYKDYPTIHYVYYYPEYIYTPTKIEEEPKEENKVVKEEKLKRTVTLD